MDRAVGRHDKPCVATLSNEEFNLDGVNKWQVAARGLVKMTKILPGNMLTCIYLVYFYQTGNVNALSEYLARAWAYDRKCGNESTNRPNLEIVLEPAHRNPVCTRHIFLMCANVFVVMLPIVLVGQLSIARVSTRSGGLWKTYPFL